MDKAWAVRAGLGWLGKHSNLITKEYGSWVFLGEILLNLELEYDTETIEDHCGNCTRCLDACPTNAIVAPYLIDSKACLSYQTIESRDETLPAEITENLTVGFTAATFVRTFVPGIVFKNRPKKLDLSRAQKMFPPI
jgi:epoxyqueuosine reductase